MSTHCGPVGFRARQYGGGVRVAPLLPSHILYHFDRPGRHRCGGAGPGVPWSELKMGTQRTGVVANLSLPGILVKKGGQGAGKADEEPSGISRKERGARVWVWVRCESTALVARRGRLKRRHAEPTLIP